MPRESKKKVIKKVRKYKSTTLKPRKTGAVPKSVKTTYSITKPPKERDSTITTSIVGIDGKAKGRISLPKELFGVKVIRQLIAQAVRGYLANQRQGRASTKTRGEVEGSTRKIYRQKGTGRARHGAIRAPIFVGGGIVFGPKPRDYSLKFPKSMKRLALASALTLQFTAGNVIVVDGLSDLKPKTKNMAETLEHIGAFAHNLLVVPPTSDTVLRAARNLPNIDLEYPQNIHPYSVLKAQKVIFMKEALGVVKDTFVR